MSIRTYRTHTTRIAIDCVWFRKIELQTRESYVAFRPVPQR